MANTMQPIKINSKKKNGGANKRSAAEEKILNQPTPNIESKKSKSIYSKDKNGNTIGPKGNKIGRPKLKERKIQMSFSVKESYKKELVAYCEENDMNFSFLVNSALKEYIKNNS